MRPKQLRRFLTAMVKAREPVCVVGKPGIGKTDIWHQVCSDLGHDLIVTHPVIDDPTDYKGMPWVLDGEAKWLPFGDLRQAMNAKRPTLWVFDDFGHGARSVQAVTMQLFLARRVGERRISDKVTFGMATNDVQHGAGVNPVITPVRSRTCIVELETHIDDWSEWALENEIRPEVLAFLRHFRPDLLCEFECGPRLENCPLPRTWAKVSKALGTLGGEDHALVVEGISGYVGRGAGGEFAAWLKTYQELPSVREALREPEKVKFPKEPSTLFAFCTGVASLVEARNFGALCKMVSILTETDRGEFAALMLRDAVRRKPELHKTEEFVDVASELGKLLTGVGL